MDDQQQDTEVFISPRDPASDLDETSAAAAAAVWEEATKAIGETPSAAEGPAGGGQSGGGGSTDPWDAPSDGEGGGIIAEFEREQANRLPEDDTPPTGFLTDRGSPDGEIPPDAETFTSNQ